MLARRPNRCRGSAGHVGLVLRAADRVSEGRRFLELALSATDDDAPVESRIEQPADLCYIATEEFDVGPALVAGERAATLAAILRNHGSVAPFN